MPAARPAPNASARHTAAPADGRVLPDSVRSPLLLLFLPRGRPCNPDRASEAAVPQPDRRKTFCGSPSYRSPPPLSVELARHATGVVGVVDSAVGARCARRSEISQCRHTLRPAGAARLPQVGADQRLRAMLERLLDRNHDHRRRLLAIDRKTPLEGRIGADPGPA